MVRVMTSTGSIEAGWPLAGTCAARPGRPFAAAESAKVAVGSMVGVPSDASVAVEVGDGAGGVVAVGVATGVPVSVGQGDGVQVPIGASVGEGVSVGSDVEETIVAGEGVTDVAAAAVGVASPLPNPDPSPCAPFNTRGRKSRYSGSEPGWRRVSTTWPRFPTASYMYSNEERITDPASCVRFLDCPASS